ncbi:Na+/H+ antiporter [Archaeoglobus veneficus]|uniref:Na+/H+ antiporter n=1 Tax=Archaeoglobus veneficus (strain DSM 11195 / SNP6) TaxID=693661 RepID=F2KP15_ARCVS|nr:Na+/H+ antiporter [Archaeoglobus veneficus]AEA46323.1 Na+/H+ antiporter [Archaeoglobus veneficus SNP6]
MHVDILAELVSLLLIACAIGIAVKYVKLPYTIALVIVGLAVGYLKVMPEIVLTEEIVFFLILPPLLFEGALNMDLQHLRDNIRPIGLLSTAGVLISTVFIGFIIHKALGIPLPVALLFGAMITPTDPVSVLATFKNLGVTRRLTTIVEGESILNDGTAVVIFSILLEMIRSGELNIFAGIFNFIFVCIGGAAVGAVLGYAAYRAMKKIDDHEIEVALTLVLAFSAFLIAEKLHVSGVIAVVAAGLLIGNYGMLFAMSPSTRLTLATFWGFTVFLINSIVFILIGMDIASRLPGFAYAIGVAILASIAGRALAVYPLLNLPRMQIPKLWQHVVFWGGLHGTIPVALALSLEDIPHRELIAGMTLGVVLFSLVVQGLSLEFFIKRSELARREEKRLKYEEMLARSMALMAGRKELERMIENGELAEGIGRQILADIDGLLESTKEELTKLCDDELTKDILKIAWKKVLLAEKSAIRDAAIRGLISEEVAKKIEEEINDQLTALED